MVVLYISLNVLAVMFVPIVHSITFTITALDTTNEKAVQVLSVALEMPNTTNVPLYHHLPVTHEKHCTLVSVAIQEQPLWAFPPLGYHHFDGYTFRLFADGYLPKDVPLCSYLKSVPFYASDAELFVHLSPEMPTED